ncbi:hypothetical protein HYT55_01140 [Candidatus Woesearchaeota archaeon]|nr:hypothetical protein [Candidatus Woesearchaeota archaeon]
MNTKGTVAIIIIAVALALVLLGTFIINLASRECNNNRDCTENAYCGTDYECHEFPKSVVVEKNNLVWPSMIISLGLVLTAFVYKNGRLPLQKRKE